MNTVGIIAEYNPFHKGHALHLNKSKSITGCANVMVVISGNFVQRGEPAIVDKMCRTRMALNSGADIVIELPVYYATASAEDFALGSAALLNASGIVTDICFGSECGDINMLRTIANALAAQDGIFIQELKYNLNKGSSFPFARNAALLAQYGPQYAKIMENPNNILAVCYINAINKICSHIKTHTIPRVDAKHNDMHLYDGISSAAAIRQSIAHNQLEAVSQAMPKPCFDLLMQNINTQGAAKLDNLSDLFHYIIKTNGKQWLKNIQNISEGLENRILHVSGQAYHIEDIISQIKTKRYTFAKIRRILLYCLLNITREECALYAKNGGPQYIRVLGFRKNKAFLLKKMADHAKLPIVTNIKYADKLLNTIGMSMLMKEIETTDIFHISREKYREKPCPRHIEKRQPLVIT